MTNPIRGHVQRFLVTLHLLPFLKSSMHADRFRFMLSSTGTFVGFRSMVEQGLEQECGHFGHSDAHGQWDTRHSMESATFNSRLTSTQSGRSSAYTYFFHRNRPPCMRSRQRACCSIWTAHCLVGPVCMTVLMLVDSTPAVEATWRDFSERHGLDLTMVLQSEQIHRRRVD